MRTVTHTVVTIERAGGYAAFCNDCHACTFGGFPTRSAARSACHTTDAGPGRTFGTRRISIDA